MEIQSPYYIIDEKRLVANLKKLKFVEEEADIHILIALKAFSFWKAFPIIKKYFPVGAASSYNEARLIYEELGSPAHTFSTIFYEDDFDGVCKYSSHLIFNSVNQFKKFKKRAIEKGMSIGLRVNPGWSDVETDLYNPASPSSRLGVSSEALGDFWDDKIDGLHFHVLCESNSYSLEKAFENFESRFGHLLHKVKWLNMGGGHLITSEGYDVDHLIKLLKRIKNTYNVDIHLEPGAAFVWQTGELITTVMDIVHSGKDTTAILDISFTCHMPDTLEMPYKPKVKGEVAHSDFKYRMGGTSCLAGDFLENFFFDKPLEVGDELEFQDMIQYTLVKTTFFNGVKHPAVVLNSIDDKKIILKEFDYMDFKNKS